jgi:hypothetical protein
MMMVESVACVEVLFDALCASDAKKPSSIKCGVAKLILSTSTARLVVQMESWETFSLLASQVLFRCEVQESCR